MKKILLLTALAAAFCFVGCNEAEQGDMRIELASPKPVITTKLATATATWNEIDKTGGYAYAVDASEDYTIVDAEVTSVDLSGLSRGNHIFKIYSVGVDGKSFDSAIREVEFVIDPSIASPYFTYVSENDGEATVTWTAIEGASGYKYKGEDDANWTTVGADVLTVTITGIPAGRNYEFSLIALGNPPLSEDSAPYVGHIDLRTTLGLWAIIDSASDPVELVETGADTKIFTATVSCKASDTFYINIDNVKHGFLTYSGNGGVGTVNNLNAAVPFYNGATYYVRESIGLLSSETPLNYLYTNVSADCSVFVRVDKNGTTPSYYLRLVENNPDIVLAQYFDLMAYGGDWAVPCAGTAYSDYGGGAITDVGYTGLSGGTKGGKSSTAFGSTWSANDIAPAFIKNKGMEDWTFESLYEFAGYMRMGNSSPVTCHGVLTTPALGSSGKMEVTFDGLMFANFRDPATAYIEVKVLNGGTISAASVVKDNTGSPINITVVGNNSFHITNAYHTDYANAVAKKWSNYTFTVEGATVTTQITWNSKTDVAISSQQYRYCIDNIVVKKK